MFTISPNVDNLLSRYAEMMTQANQRLNLVSRRYSVEQVRNLVRESLLPLEWKLCRLSPPLLDIGTGAGIPGLPLAMALPGGEVVLLDSDRRKTSFVKFAAAELGLSGVRVVEMRAEAFSGLPENAGRFSTVVSRGVGDPAAMLCWAERLLKPEGELVLWKGSDSLKLMKSDRTIWGNSELYQSDFRVKLLRLEKR